MPRPVSQLVEWSRRSYPRGAWLLRRLQHYRPFICPFEVLLEHAPANAWVLDVGCGGGLWLRLLEAAGKLRVGIGFDSSPGAIALAQGSEPALGAERAGASLSFRLLSVDAPWPGPPSDPERFDLVSIIDVLHHVPVGAQEGVIRQAARRVGPGGTLLYKDMGRRPLWRAWMNRLHDLAMARQWINYVDPALVEAWAAEEGLRLVHSERLNRWWYAHDLRVFKRA